jgi:hypothetical protein
MAKSTKESAPDMPSLSDALSDHLISKSNSLVRASYKLSLQEQRLILAAISKLDSRKLGIRPGHDQSHVRITAAEFAETFGISTKNAYEELRWVSKVRYHDGEGWADLTFAQDILPYLTLLRKQFTSYKLKQVAGLRSVYSIRIFELCAQFAETGLLRISLADLITSLDLPYTRYIDIVRRVIQPAVDELRVKSNLEIIWRPIKEGRAVKTIEFQFHEAAQQKLELETPLPE